MLNDNSLISIIIPVYNVEKYLETCVYSVIYQTYENLEIILVDDGSSDNSGKLCDRFLKLDKRIKVIHKANGGLSDARNAGIEVAHGEYLGFVDSDDWISTEMYYKLYNNVIENNADISVCERIIVDENGGLDDKGTSGAKAVLNNSDALDVLYENKKYYSHAWNKLFKRELFDEIRFPKDKFFEDVFIMHELFGKAEKVVFEDKGLYFYRQRNGSIVNSENWKSWRNYIEAIQCRMASKYSFGKEILIYRHLLSAAKFVKGLAYQFPKNKEIDFFIEYINVSIKKNYRIKYGFKVLCEMLMVKNYFKEYNFLKKIKNSKKIEILKLRLAPIKLNKTHRKQRIILMGSPEYNNLGDLAIGYSIKKYIRKYFPNIEYDEVPEKYLRNNILPHNVDETDIILLVGGGNFGDVYKEQQYIRKLIINKYKNNKIIMFPQTMYFTDTPEGLNELNITKSILANNKNIILFAREKFSYEVMKADFLLSNCFLCPDIVLFNKINTYHNRKGILFCLRGDIESILSVDDREYLLRSLYRLDENIDIWDTCLPYNVSISDRDNKVEQAMTYVGNHKLIVTDRLHGVIFAAISGTPCVAISNYNYKISGIYEWVKKLGFIRLENDIDNIAIVIQELLDKYPQGTDERIDEISFDILRKQIEGALL